MHRRDAEDAEKEEAGLDRTKLRVLCAFYEKACQERPPWRTPNKAEARGFVRLLFALVEGWSFAIRCMIESVVGLPPLRRT